jgi:hypothetical protein
LFSAQSTTARQDICNHVVAFRRSWRRAACLYGRIVVRLAFRTITIRQRSQQHIVRHNTELIWQPGQRQYRRSVGHIAASKHRRLGEQPVWRRPWRHETCDAVCLSFAGRTVDIATANTNGRFLQQLVLQTRDDAAIDHEPSLFGGASTQQQPQQQPQQQQGASLSQSNAGTTRSAHFDNLLERGRKRNAGENGGSNFDELPSLQLGLGDIARKVRNLGAGGPSADQVRDGAQDRAA